MAEAVVLEKYRDNFVGCTAHFNHFHEYWLAVVACDRFADDSWINLHDFKVKRSSIAVFPIPGQGNLIYDCAWSTKNPNLLVAVGEDKVTHLIDVARSPPNNPIIRSYDGHHGRKRSVEWHPSEDSFMTASEDGNVIYRKNGFFLEYYPHPAPVYSISWDPHIHGRFATTSQDGRFRVFESARGNRPVAIVQVDHEPVISCNWNFHGPACLVTATQGRTNVKTWDIRQFNNPVHVLHQIQADPSPLVKVKFSPFWPNEIVASSVDGNIILWDYGIEAANPLITLYRHHYGPAYGLDTSKQASGLLASTGDGLLQTWLHAPPE